VLAAEPRHLLRRCDKANVCKTGRCVLPERRRSPSSFQSHHHQERCSTMSSPKPLSPFPFASEPTDDLTTSSSAAAT
jgi:hypothetical protein